MSSVNGVNSRNLHPTLHNPSSSLNGDKRLYGPLTLTGAPSSLLGIDFEGTATCTQHESGQSYAFKTEGGIESTFTYLAEADGTGTKLTIRVDFELPASILSLAGLDGLLASAKQKEIETVTENLKTILNQ